MKFDRYLMLDAEHDHEVGKLMPKLKVISGFTKENIENVFGINNKWMPKNNEKLFFVSGCKVPRFKLKNKFTCTNKVSNADAAFISKESINTSSIIDVAKAYNVSEAYGNRDTSYITEIGEFIKLTDPDLYVLYNSLISKFDTIYLSENFRVNSYTNFNNNKNWNNYISPSSWTFKYQYQRNPDGNTICIVDRNSDLHNATCDFYLASDMQEILNDGNLIIDFEKYKELKAMSAADSESLVLSMEIMANSDFKSSVPYLCFLLKEFNGAMKYQKEFHHVNFQSLINFLNLGSEIKDDNLTIHTISKVLKEHKQFTRVNVQMLSQLCVNDYIRYRDDSDFKEGPVLKSEINTDD